MGQDTEITTYTLTTLHVSALSVPAASTSQVRCHTLGAGKAEGVLGGWRSGKRGGRRGCAVQRLCLGLLPACSAQVLGVPLPFLLGSLFPQQEFSARLW